MFEFLLNYACLDPILTDLPDFIFFTKAEEHEALARELHNAGVLIFLGAAILILGSVGLIRIAKIQEKIAEEEKQERERQRQEYEKREEERRRWEQEIQDRLDGLLREPPA